MTTQTNRRDARWISALAACVATVVTLTFAARSIAVDAEGDKPKPIDRASVAGAQAALSQRFARLEETLGKLSLLERSSNPRRAALLAQALGQAQRTEIKTKLGQISALIEAEKFEDAVKAQAAAEKSLDELLKLLTNEDRPERLKSEQEKIRERIAEVERLIRLQRSLEGDTEAGADEQKLANEQDGLAERTDKLAKEIGAENGETEGEKSDAKGKSPDKQGDKNDPSKKGKDDEDKEGEPKKSDDSPEGDPSKQGDPKSGDKPKTDEPTKGDDAPKDEPKGDPSKQDGDKGGDSKKDESKGDKSKGNESKKGDESKGEKGEKSEGQPRDQPRRQGDKGQPQDSGEQSDESQSKDPVKKRLDQARKRMEQARKDLQEAKRKESLDQQRKAQQELETAKAELERILRQLREEEIERMLASLEARLKNMLERQQRVLDQTKQLAETPAENRPPELDVQAARLGKDEGKIAVEADRAVQVLQEEGSSTAFPAAMEQIRDDMQQTAQRLADAKLDAITVGLEEEIVAGLQELLAALEKTRKENEQKKQERQQNEQQGQPMQQEEQPLVGKIAELKMIKQLQLRVNSRTQRYAKMLDDPSDPVGQANSRELGESLGKLSEKEQQVLDITRELLKEAQR